jgi:hypothetical protein
MTQPMAKALKADVLHNAQRIWGSVARPGEVLTAPVPQGAPRVSPGGRAYTIGP